MPRSRVMQKVYLGDAVYVQYDGYNIVLTTENGISTTNMICLEPEVLDSFTIYLKTLAEVLRMVKDGSTQD